MDSNVDKGHLKELIGACLMELNVEADIQISFVLYDVLQEAIFCPYYYESAANGVNFRFQLNSKDDVVTFMNNLDEQDIQTKAMHPMFSHCQVSSIISIIFSPD